MYSISDVLFRFLQGFPLTRHIQFETEGDIELTISSKDNGISVFQLPSPPVTAIRRDSSCLILA